MGLTKENTLQLFTADSLFSCMRKLMPTATKVTQLVPGKEQQGKRGKLHL